MARGISRGAVIFLAVAVLVFLHLAYQANQPTELETRLSQIPVMEELEHARGKGGRWHIPESWKAEGGSSSLSSEANIVEAAQYALDLATQQKQFLNNTRIPRFLHQTWRTADIDQWPEITRTTVATWTHILRGVPVGSEMAYFLWDDDGIAMLLENFEMDLANGVAKLPYPVEKADVMRIAALKWFGGVYADVDTTPLKHPDLWVSADDLWVLPDENAAWTNAASSSVPTVSAIFGIEADNAPDPDSTYWRMGYRWPIQLSNWALAMAPHHPVADDFLVGLAAKIAAHIDDLGAVNPLDITGPPILTASVRNVALRDDPSFVWDALSGRNGDPKGGRSKIVAGDVAILPITAFSPGRGWFQNMGSASVNHANACLMHMATGTWRHTNFKVAYGKLCRSLLGLCRDWEDIQAPV